MFCFPYEFHHQNIISIDKIMHPQFEMIHNILDMDNTYVYLILIIRINLYIESNVYPSIIYCTFLF